MKLAVKFYSPLYHKEARKTVPLGLIYAPTIRIYDRDIHKWTDYWSMRIQWTDITEDFNRIHHGSGSFLSGLAPMDVLLRERAFHIFEGAHEVGYGTVLKDQ